MFARGDIVIGTGSGLTLPLESIVSSDGYSYAFVLRPDRTVERRRIETGAVLGDAIEVTSGLSAGERVVAKGAGFLKDGDLVEVAADGEAGRPRTASVRGGERVMNFVTWSIRNPVPVIVLFVGLTVAGLFSFPKLGVQDRPDIEFPAVVVTVSYAGVAPTQMESEVTRKVEDAVATISGIEQMTSTVDEGVSTTSIEFHFGTDLAQALDDVRDAMTRIRADLPQDANEPIVSRVTTAGGSLVTWTRLLRQHERHGALVVRRSRRRARALVGARHWTGVPRRRRVARDPRGSRSGSHGRARRQRERRVAAVAPHPGRVSRRRGPHRRPRADRTHDRHAAFGARARPAADRAGRRPQRPARHDRRRARPGRPSGGLSHC